MIQIKLEKQLPNYCGPASLKMVLDYYGVKKTQQEIGKLSEASESGTDPWDLLHVAKLLGFNGEYIVGCSISKLKEFISKNIPVIVDFQKKIGGGHYSVVIAIENGRIFLADPKNAEIISFSEEEFLERWWEEYCLDGKNHKIYAEAIAIQRK